MSDDSPNWRKFTDTERLDWLMEFIRNPLVSRRSIDEAIARDEFFANRDSSPRQVDGQ